MSKTYKYIIPEGVAQSFHTDEGKVALGPGEYEFDKYQYCSGTMLTKPHWKFDSGTLKNIQNKNSSIKAQIMFLLSYRLEIVNPTQYINCTTPVLQAYNGEIEESLDGEDYIYAICTNRIVKHLRSVTFEEMCALKDTEIDLTQTDSFFEDKKKMLDNAGVNVTHINLVITGIDNREVE